MNADHADTARGYIAPRKSWPRPATPCDLTPAWAGEFSSFDDWVNFATKRLTGTVEPALGAEVTSICVDAIGRRCTMGVHFMRARDEGTFPVRYFFDMRPAEPGALDRAKADADLCAEQWTAEITHGNALRERVASMHAALIMALPYIETAESDPAYKPGAVAKVTAAMRAAINA